MAANPNDARTKRRQAMGDDPNRVAISPQPIPGMPQKNNVMNYPMTDTNGQMGQMIGAGPYNAPYGDMGNIAGEPGIDGNPRVGTVGFQGNTGTPQFMQPGTGLNQMSGQFIGNQIQPDPEQMKMMEPNYEVAQAQGLTMPNPLNAGQPVSYAVSAMGPTGAPAFTPGQMPPEMTYGSPDTLPMPGMGMNTGRGGGRNQTA